MNDEQDLLAAIAARPFDETPRLVYADWLDDNGRYEVAAVLRGPWATGVIDVELDYEHDRFPTDSRMLFVERRLSAVNVWVRFPLSVGIEFRGVVVTAPFGGLLLNVAVVSCYERDWDNRVGGWTERWQVTSRDFTFIAA